MILVFGSRLGSRFISVIHHDPILLCVNCMNRHFFNEGRRVSQKGIYYRALVITMTGYPTAHLGGPRVVEPTLNSGPEGVDNTSRPGIGAPLIHGLVV